MGVLRKIIIIKGEKKSEARTRRGRKGEFVDMAAHQREAAAGTAAAGREKAGGCRGKKGSPLSLPHRHQWQIDRVFAGLCDKSGGKRLG